jgi:hypothetical protein
MVVRHAVDTPFGQPGYLVLGGSRLYGIDTPESDYDYIGAVVEPETYRVGLRSYQPVGKHAQHGFEQHMFSGPNYEGSIYSLWKLVSMFAEGNPTILCLLFAHPLVDDYGINTDRFRSLVISRKSGHRFLKYMEAQRKSMIGQRAKHVTRLELVDKHGYDTKFAGHLIRLGYQGIEFLQTGKITLPLRGDQRQAVLDIRAGRWSEQEVIDMSTRLEGYMQGALEGTSLPEEPDHEGLSEWVVGAYRAKWANTKALAMKRTQIIAGQRA